MLRRALKRPAADNDVTLGEKNPKQRDDDNSNDQTEITRSKMDLSEKKLEDIVFGGSQGILEDLEDFEVRKKVKSKTKKHLMIESEKQIAWEDNFEKPRKGGKDLPTPQWARLDKDDDDGVDSQVEELLHTAGDLLVKSSALPAGMLQIKKLADANADDTRGSKLQNVEFHPTAKVILTAGTSQRLNLFQIDGRHNPKIQSVYFEDYPIHTAHFSSNGEQIIVGSDRKNFLYYDMIAGKVVNVPKIKAIEGNTMARFVTSPDGRFLAFLGRYGSIHLISAKSKEWITTLKMNGDVQSVTFSRDGSQMFSSGNCDKVFVWDMNTRNCVHTFTDDGCVQGTAVAVSPNNQYIACGSQSGVVNIYEQETCLQEHYPKPLRSIMNLTTTCSKAKFNCSSEILAIASNEMTKAVKLVHFPSMHVFANFPEQTDRQLRIPKCLDFSPNGGYMAIGNQKGHALLYRLGHYDSY